jgi:hypothetical protein
VGRVDVAHGLAAEVDPLAVREPAGRPVGEVADADVDRDRSVRDLGVRACLEPQVHRAAFVRLDMAEADPAQPLGRDEPGDLAEHRGEQPAVAGVEEQGLVAEQQILVEREAGRGRDLRDIGGNPEDSVGDLVHPGGHGPVPFNSSRPRGSLFDYTSMCI